MWERESLKMLLKKHINFLLLGITVSIMVNSAPTSAAKGNFPLKDYVETVRSMDLYSNRINDTFLTILANEYKSYALFKANFTPDYNMANHFAIKAINAYHGEHVKPEDIYKRNLPFSSIVELSRGHDDLTTLLNTDLVYKYPQLMAEAQAKFDCWADSEASGLGKKQSASCRNRFLKAKKYLFEKLTDCCNCKKDKKTKQTTVISKKSEKYTGKILPIKKWPNLPAVSNNPPVPVVRQVIIKELTVSKEIKDAILKIEKSIKDINTKLANSQTKSDIENIKQQISELKQTIKDSSQEDYIELQKKLSELEDKLSNISCSESEPIEYEDENTEKDDEDKISYIEATIEFENSNNELDEKTEEIEEEEQNPDEPEEILVKEFEEESGDDYNEEESNEEYIEEEDDDNNEEIEEENTEFETTDEDEYLEIEIQDSSSELLPYEVFFDWNDASVKPKFNDALKDIAQNAKKSEEIIVIKGHTDASGSNEYNQKLSKKRAENVGKIIMSYGVPRNKIILQGVGSSEPKVKTKIGEKNPENRRVVIK